MTMFQSSYARSFIAAWHVQGKRGRHFIAQAAERQRGNLESIKASGRRPAGVNVAEYEKSVLLLESEVQL